MTLSKTLAQAAAGLFYLVAVAWSPAVAADAEVTWPQGWTIRDRPVPTTVSGQTFAGSNQLALKLNGEGAPLAAMALTTLVRRTDDSVRLDTEMQTMLTTVQNGYSAKGLKASCGATIKTTLGKLPALQSLCTVRTGDVLSLEQVVIVGIGVRRVYSLSYTAPPVGFDAYTVDFAAVRGSLHIE
jgi:hypothetical protein